MSIAEFRPTMKGDATPVLGSIDITRDWVGAKGNPLSNVTSSWPSHVRMLSGTASLNGGPGAIAFSGAKLVNSLCRPVPVFTVQIAFWPASTTNARFGDDGLNAIPNGCELR